MDPHYLNIGVKTMIYLDNSATTRTLPTAAEAAQLYMCENFFNPASGYGPAVQAERDVNAARERLSRLLGASPDEILYTSGGTESNNMAIWGVLKARRGISPIVTSMVEHPSVYEVCRAHQAAGNPVQYVGVDHNGAVDLEALVASLRPETALVSIMHVNNETGAINDIGAIRELIRSHAPNAVFHMDGVQAFCKLPFAPVKCDLYSISGHKFHAPKGIGALYVKKDLRFAGGQIGGGQERNLRSGTTNTPGVMGMDAALAAYAANQSELIETMRACKIRLAKNLTQLEDVFLNGPAPEAGAPHVLNVSFMGVRGEVLLHAVEGRGLYVSTGSACSTHKKGKNRILEAMGVTGARQEGAIRFSLCPFNTLKEMDTAADIIAEQISILRRFKRR